jgi:hypothetical protein
MLLVPPLEHPTSDVLPAGVCTATLKVPGAPIIDALMVALSCELLVTAVVMTVPLKSNTEEETNWAPVAVSTKLGDTCEKAIMLGEIELRLGAGRALPQSGFRALHPVNATRITSSASARPIPVMMFMNEASFSWVRSQYSSRRKGFTRKAREGRQDKQQGELISSSGDSLAPQIWWWLGFSISHSWRPLRVLQLNSI